MTISRPRTEAPRRRPPTPRLGRSGTRGARAAFLGTGPTAWYDARDLLTTTQQTLVNRVGAGSAQLGSTSGSDTNDPTVIPFDADSAPFARIPNVAGNYISTSLTAPVDGQTYVEVVARIRPRSIAADIVFGGTASTHLGVYLRSTGKLQIYHLSPGALAVGNSQSPSAIPGFAADTWYWVKLKLTQSSALCEYWYSAETTTNPAAVTWTSLGSVAGTNAGIGFNTGQQSIFSVGSYSSGLAPGGPFDIQYFSINWSGQAWKSWTCDTGQTTNNTLTVNRSTTGLTTAVVTRPLLMADGTDDYLQLPAGDIPTFTPTTGSFTVMYVGIIHNVPAATAGILWSSESADNVGALMFATAGAATLTVRTGGGSGTVDSTIGYTAGTRTAFAGVFSNGTSTAWTSTAGPDLTPGDYSAVTGMTHGSAPRLFNRANATLNRPLGATWNAIVQWNRALTTTELTTASNYLLGTYA